MSHAAAVVFNREALPGLRVRQLDGDLRCKCIPGIGDQLHDCDFRVGKQRAADGVFEEARVISRLKKELSWFWFRLLLFGCHSVAWQ